MQINSKIINGLIGDHIATGIPMEIPMNTKEMQLALDKTNPNASWDLMCDSLVSRGEQDPRGQMNIAFIRINGVEKRFH